MVQVVMPSSHPTVDLSPATASVVDCHVGQHEGILSSAWRFDPHKETNSLLRTCAFQYYCIHKPAGKYVSELQFIPWDKGWAQSTSVLHPPIALDIDEQISAQEWRRRRLYGRIHEQNDGESDGMIHGVKHELHQEAVIVAAQQTPDRSDRELRSVTLGPVAYLASLAEDIRNRDQGGNAPITVVDVTPSSDSSTGDASDTLRRAVTDLSLPLVNPTRDYAGGLTYCAETIIAGSGLFRFIYHGSPYIDAHGNVVVHASTDPRAARALQLVRGRIKRTAGTTCKARVVIDPGGHGEERRRIDNVDDIIDAIKQHYPHVTVSKVALDSHTTPKVQQWLCAEVVIGLGGPALDGAYLLSPQATLVEVVPHRLRKNTYQLFSQVVGYSYIKVPGVYSDPQPIISSCPNPRSCLELILTSSVTAPVAAVLSALGNIPSLQSK